MAKRWNYVGDVNIEYGGYFWRQISSDYAECVNVFPLSDGGGPNNIFAVEVGGVYISDDKAKRDAALSVIGHDGAKPDFDMLVEGFMAYNGIERDSTYYVQVGAKRDEARDFQDVQPDVTLRANASLLKFIKREYVRQ